MTEIYVKRIFVGGLFPEVTEGDIRGRFTSFGDVANVDIVQKKDEDGRIQNTFAYVNIHISEPKLRKCMSVYSKTKWKGHELKMQLAKEDYTSRLKREKLENGTNSTSTPKDKVSKSYQEIESKLSKIKAAIPGTQIGDDKNWIVGKYGRALPIVYLRKPGSVKLKKFDPSKHCHQLKRLKGDMSGEDASSLNDLSWAFEEPDTSNGVYSSNFNRNKPDSGNKRKRKPLSSDGDNHNSYTNEKIPRNKSTGENKMEFSIAKDDENVEILGTKKCKDMKIGEKRKGTLSPYTIETNVTHVEFDDSTNEGLKGDLNQNKSSTYNSISIDLNSETGSEIECSQTEDFISSVAKDSKTSSMINFPCQSMQENSSKNNSLWDSFQKGDLNFSGNEKMRSNELGESIVSQIAKLRKSSQFEKQGGEDENSSLEEDYDEISLDVSNLVFKEDSIKNKVSGSLMSSSSGESDDEQTKLGDNEDKRKPDRGNGLVPVVRTEKSKNITVPSSKENSNYNPMARTNAESSEIDVVNSVLISDNSSTKKPHSSKHNEIYDDKSPAKKCASEATRMKSLEERQLKEKERRDLVKNALRIVDNGSRGMGRLQSHVKFDSSDDEEQNKSKEPLNKDKKNIFGSKVTGDAAVSWLGLDSSGDSDTEEQERHDFSIKPQFEGEKGEKLFKLQQKIGLDERFRLDARFIDNAHEADIASVLNNKNEVQSALSDEDTLDYDLQAEKTRTLSLLEQVLGKEPSSFSTKSKKDHAQQAPVRYDPTRDDHTQYELQKKASEEELDDWNEVRAKEKGNVSDDETKTIPAVSNEKFYEVTTSLKDLFQNKEAATFSFLNDNSANQIKAKPLPQGLAEVMAEKKRKIHNFLEDQQEQEIEMKANETLEFKKPKVQRFFFTKDDARLQTEAEDGPSAFVRKDSLENIIAARENTKKDLRLDYKKKHKDALRRKKKLNERRPSIK